MHMDVRMPRAQDALERRLCGCQTPIPAGVWQTCAARYDRWRAFRLQPCAPPISSHAEAHPHPDGDDLQNPFADPRCVAARGTRTATSIRAPHSDTCGPRHAEARPHQNLRQYPVDEAPEQASMPIRHGDNRATCSSILSRETLGSTSTALPAASTPCSAKTFFARSMPSVTMRMWTSPCWCGVERLHFPSRHLVAETRHCAAHPGWGSPFHSLGGAHYDLNASADFDWYRGVFLLHPNRFWPITVYRLSSRSLGWSDLFKQHPARQASRHAGP